MPRQAHDRDAQKSSRWGKWVKYATLGATTLAVVATIPTAEAAFPGFAAAHFRGQYGSLAHAHAQALAQARADAIALQQSAHRRLDTNSTLNDAVNKANEVGASVRKAVKQLRGGTDKFYNDLVTAVKIELCEQLKKSSDVTKQPQIRFVDASSDRAYKDDSGNCVQVQITSQTDDAVKQAYAQGQCEVKPNCYWAEIGPNDTERRPVYSTEEAAQPADGAMTKDKAKDTVMKWAQGLMIFVVPGIILAVLSLLTMIFFLMCRCCCNRCGGRSPKEGGYTCMQKFWPLLFFLLFAIGVIVVAGVSLLYQKTVTSSVTDTFNAASETLDNANTWIGDIESPLVSIRDSVTDSADKIKVQLAGTDFIEDGLTGLTGKLEDFGSYSANRTLPTGCELKASDKFCLPCLVCTTISTEVDKATTQITDNAGQGISQLKSVRENLNTMLVDIAASVKSTVNNQVDKLGTLVNTINDAKGKVDDIQSQYEKQKSAQQAGVLALFALALVVIAIGFVGVLFGLTPLKFLANIIHIAYIIGFIALILTFLISAIFLAISVVLGDVCEVSKILVNDWTVALGDEAKGINACFKNESLIDTFNLSSSLEFARGGIKFPDNDLSSMLDFSELDTFANTIKATNESTFNLKQSDIDTALSTLNGFVTQAGTQCKPSDSYTEANVDEPWTVTGGTRTPSTQTPEEYVKLWYSSRWDAPCDKTADGKAYTCPDGGSTCTFSDFVVSIYRNAKMAVLVKRDSGQFITDLHTNITVVTDYTDDFKSKTTTLDGKITTIKNDLEASLIKSVDDFEVAMHCTFIATGYYKIYDALCGDLMPAFTMISLMLFLAGIFLIPVNVCLIIACKRLKARGNGGHVMDNEMKFK